MAAANEGAAAERRQESHEFAAVAGPRGAHADPPALLWRRGTWLFSDLRIFERIVLKKGNS